MIYIIHIIITALNMYDRNLYLCELCGDWHRSTRQTHIGVVPLTVCLRPGKAGHMVLDSGYIQVVSLSSFTYFTYFH